MKVYETRSASTASLATIASGPAEPHGKPTVRVDGTVRPLPGQRHGTAASVTAVPTATSDRSGRYTDLADRALARRLADEDAAVERGLSPFERLTCPAHRRWMHQCVSSPQHASPVTGHRWCRDCGSAATVAIDELAGDVTVICPRCRRTPEGIATRQIVRACRASLAAVHDRRSAATPRLLRELNEPRCA
ncbi:MAG TPA: hypothetical protein VFG87_13540 [Amycolatopsis sp.]|nr:hypothetical protein [Amycolatopsis sp.]